MSTTKVNKALVIDANLEVKLKSFRSKVQLIQNPNGTYALDLSKCKKDRVEGQFDSDGSNLQGSHTVSYNLLLTSLEKRLNGKTFPDMLKQIDYRESSVPTLNNDLFTLFYVYSTLDGKSSNWYLMEKLKLVYDSTIKLFSGIYHIDTEEGVNVFKTLFFDYLYNYIVCLQYIPFSATMGQNGGRGERIKLLDKITNEREFIGYLTKLFDNDAIRMLLTKHTEGKDEKAAERAAINVLAYILMKFLFMLEGYPSAKQFFFQGSATTKSAHLQNIATVIFCHWKKDGKKKFTEPLHDNKEDIELVEKALSGIAKLRFMEYHYMFLSGFSRSNYNRTIES